MQQLEDFENAVSDLEYSFEFQPLEFPIVWVSSQIIALLMQILIITLLEAGILHSKFWKSLGRNTLMLLVGCTLYSLIGFNVMYDTNSSSAGAVMYDATSMALTDLLFQTFYAATFITLLFPLINKHFKLLTSILLIGLMGILFYPIAGRLSWGQGFLFDLNYSDFSGGMLIYGVAGAAYIVFSLLSKPFNPRINLSEKKWPLIIVTVLVILMSISQAIVPGEDQIANLSRFMGIAGLCAGISGVITGLIIERRFTLSSFYLGFLSATALLATGIDLFPPFNSMALGTLAGIIFQSAKWGLRKLAMADPAHLGAALVCPAIVGGLIPAIKEPSRDLFVGQITGVITYVAIGACLGLILYVTKRIENARISR